jgi:hypothetical protein
MEKSLKFEAFLEDLVKRQGYDPIKQEGSYEVMRNVILRRGEERRQIDIMYYHAVQGRLYKILIEAKYTSDGVVSNTFKSPRYRTGLDGNEMRINGPFEQLMDTKVFGLFHYAILATNGRFDARIHDKIRQVKGVSLLEHDRLTRIYKGNIDSAIVNTYVRPLKPSIINVM